MESIRICDLRRTDSNQYQYLLVIDTSDLLPLGLTTTNQISCSFEIATSQSEIATERFFAQKSIRRSHTLTLPQNEVFSRGSRRFFMVSSLGIDLDLADKIHAWISCSDPDVCWYPFRISLYRMRTGNNEIPTFGQIDDHFDLLSDYKFQQESSFEKVRYQTSAINSVHDPPLSNTFRSSLRANLMSDNLWLSIFLDQRWSYFNRAARSTVAIMTVCLAAIANIMFYRGQEGPQIEIGPLKIDPSMPFVAAVTGAITVVPSVIVSFVFYKVAPYRNLSPKWYYLRTLNYIVATGLISGSVVFSGFYALTLEPNQVYKWVSAQLMSMLLDIVFIPFIRIFIITFVKYIITGKRRFECETAFIYTGDALINPNQVKTPACSRELLATTIAHFYLFFLLCINNERHRRKNKF